MPMPVPHLEEERLHRRAAPEGHEVHERVAAGADLQPRVRKPVRGERAHLRLKVGGGVPKEVDVDRDALPPGEFLGLGLLPRAVFDGTLVADWDGHNIGIRIG